MDMCVQCVCVCFEFGAIFTYSMYAFAVVALFTFLASTHFV